MGRYLRIAIGTSLLILGIAGLALPFLQGLLFIALGTMLLAKDLPLFRGIARRLRVRFPRIAAAADRARGRIMQMMHRRPPP
jgi:uncharacterized membrane protein YbaN (DUF454 family)